LLGTDRFIEVRS